MDRPTATTKRQTQPESLAYQERLSAPVWVWVVVLILVAALAVAYAVPLGATAGVILFLVVGTAACWLLLTTAPKITVDAHELQVGRAHIDWAHVGLVATLDAASADAARGRDADPRAFTVTRPLTARTAITLEVLDDQDPHPYWLVTTRHPEDLGAAITAAQQNSRAHS